MPWNPGRRQSLSLLRHQQQQQQAAEDAARTLQILLRSVSVSQLLQQPPPSRPLTAAEAGHVATCCQAVSAVAERLNTALSQQVDQAARQQVLAAVLQQQAAFNAGTLLSWVLQHPQQLQLSEMEDRFGDIHTPEALLRQSSALLKDMTCALPRSNGSEPSRTLLQQMGTSGDGPHPCTVCSVAPREEAA
jgi:hypothetical protein